MMTDAHCRSEFHFTIPLHYSQAFPLFGAWKEREWDLSWHPSFIHPNPPCDEEGAVFIVGSTVWVITAFDLASGHVGYVNVRETGILTRIDIQVRPDNGDSTNVSVVYERTALKPEAAAQIAGFARTDPQQGPEWVRLIEAYIERIRS
jgi:hypothetical protein